MVAAAVGLWVLALGVVPVLVTNPYYLHILDLGYLTAIAASG